MASALAPPFQDWPKIPYVGVGCIVEFNGSLLMVRDHKGLWSTPGGHLDFGESPVACAARETLEETGVIVRNVEFVAITNDLIEDIGRHYLTVWMRGETTDPTLSIGDPGEIGKAGWFIPAEIPAPRHVFFTSLLLGRSMPASPRNLPMVIRAAHAGVEGSP